jgi:hypothetical protein
MIKTYNVVNGTSYDESTNAEVIRVLERVRESRTRIRIHYGDIATGRDWMEENDVTGYVGRSTGTSKIPILVHNARSHGGGSILDHCIVKIVGTKGAILYQAENYQRPVLTFDDNGHEGREYVVFRDGECIATFSTFERMSKYIARFS